MAITPVSKSAPVAVSNQPAGNNTAAMCMVATLFFMWGFVTCLNDILIPHLTDIFDLSYKEAMLVQSAFFAGYFIFALPAGKLVEKIGYQRTMVFGLCTMAFGAILFIPAASVPAYVFFLAALMIVAAGMTALQVSANPYVSVLGRPETASSRLNLTQALNSLGTTVAPYFGAILILSTTPKSMAEIRQLAPDALQAYRLHEAATVKMPYLVIAGTLIALAVVIGLFKLPRIAAVEGGKEVDGSKMKLWQQRHLVLGVVAIFVYVGAEVSIGSFLVKYFVRPEIGGLTEKAAGAYLSFYWGAAMVGRFIGSALLTKLRTGPVLGTAAIVAALLVVASMLTFGHVAMWTILAVGLFNSIMFPSIFTLGIAGLGHLTGEGSGWLIAGIVGGAIIPFVQGAIADSSVGIHHAFILPVLCYLYIMFYGFRGSRQRGTAAS